MAKAAFTGMLTQSPSKTRAEHRSHHLLKTLNRMDIEWAAVINKKLNEYDLVSCDRMEKDSSPGEWKNLVK